jgi:hypothetical protein
LVTLTEAELNIAAACAVLLPTVSTLVMAPLKLTTFAETEARLLAISCAPLTFCSTAEAMRTEKPISSRIAQDIPAIASTERWVAFWIASMRLLMSRVAFAVWPASVLTSCATTANPLPDSPAREASIVALSASRFVCPAILLISSVTSPISFVTTANSSIVEFVCFISLTAPAARRDDSMAWASISAIVCAGCSPPWRRIEAWRPPVRRPQQW